MSPPFDRHLNGGGQRGGGGFFRSLSVVSRSRAGKPGRVGVSPCSIFAQGSAHEEGAKRGEKPEEEGVSIHQPTWIAGLLKKFWFSGPATLSADGATVAHLT